MAVHFMLILKLLTNNPSISEALSNLFNHRKKTPLLPRSEDDFGSIWKILRRGTRSLATIVEKIKIDEKITKMFITSNAILGPSATPQYFHSRAYNV